MSLDRAKNGSRRNALLPPQQQRKQLIEPIFGHTAHENALGGSGGNYIRGNDVANVLTGGVDGDYLEGEAGNLLVRPVLCGSF